AKHKFAIHDLEMGSDVMMYGVPVGKVTAPIQTGEGITVHNLRHYATGFHSQEKAFHWPTPDVARWRQRTFLGYRRTDGQVGTRNHWLVIPLVFCENRNVLVMKEALEHALGFEKPAVYRDYLLQLSQLYQAGKIDEAQRLRISDGDGSQRKS